MSARSKFLARAVLYVAAFLFVPLAAEGVARWADVAPRPRPKISGSILRDCADPELGIENVPGSVLQVTFRDRSEHATRVVEHRLNEQGWRGPAFEIAKPAGVLRVACVGDSQTFGMGVEEDETWPQVLAAQLDPLVEGRHEVLNFGVLSYQAAEKAHLIATRVAAYRPDLIVMQLNPYESQEAQKRFARRMVLNPVSRRLNPNRDSLLNEIRGRSHLVSFVADRLLRRAMMDNWMHAYRDSYTPEDPVWLEMREHLVRAADAAKALDARIAMVFFPMLFEHGGDLVSRRASTTVGDFCAERGIAYLDLSAEFAGRALEGLRIHPEEYHYAGSAQRTAAIAIAAFLKREGFLEP